MIPSNVLVQPKYSLIEILRVYRCAEHVATTACNKEGCSTLNKRTQLGRMRVFMFFFTRVTYANCFRPGACSCI